MKNASLLIAVVLGSLSSAVLAQPTAQAPATPATPAHQSAQDRVRQAGLTEFKQCLNNRPVEAEAYDCAYLLAAHGRSTAKLAARKPAPALLKVATVD
jgi:hypothetical protein